MLLRLIASALLVLCCICGCKNSNHDDKKDSEAAVAASFRSAKTLCEDRASKLKSRVLSNLRGKARSEYTLAKASPQSSEPRRVFDSLRWEKARKPSAIFGVLGL
jgi:hypothetical protein